MVICSGELDAVDDREANATDSSDEDNEDEGTLKCLQIDLRRFGLGKPIYSCSTNVAFLTVASLHYCRQTWPRESLLSRSRGKQDQSYVQLNFQDGELAGTSSA
jgi:hypothetical protein